MKRSVAYRDKSSGAGRVAQAPAVLVFQLTDFPAIRSAVAASGLPRACVSAPYYLLDLKHKAKMTLFDVIHEPKVSAADTRAAFALLKEIIKIVRRSPRNPIRRGGILYGFHTGASVKQVVRCFERDGFRVIRAADLPAPTARRRAPAAPAAPVAAPTWKVTPGAAKAARQLRAAFGFELPDEIHALWELARSIDARNPRRAFSGDWYGPLLAGPFDVLAGALRKQALSPILHLRHYHDPPELLTVWCAPNDSLRWLLWIDEEPTRASVLPVVHNWYDDPFEPIRPDGGSLFEAMRDVLEERAQESDGDTRRKLDEIISALRRQEVKGRDWSQRRPIAKTIDGPGVVAPAMSYRPLKAKDKLVSDHLGHEINQPGSQAETIKDLVAEAERALADGFPATALKLGRELWAANMTASAMKLLVPAYERLGRPALAAITRVHGAHRWMRSVDLTTYTRANLEADRRRASKFDPDRYPFRYRRS
jgi:hypothetical protein